MLVSDPRGIMPDPQRLTKIKRAILWIRRSLEITERTDVPESIDSVIKPVVDIFGWEALPRAVPATATNPLAAAVNTAAVPAGTFRYVLNASVEHTDTITATHRIWISKAVQNGVRVGLPLDRRVIEVGENASLDDTTYLLPGDFLFGEATIAMAIGNIAINTLFIDFPFDTLAGIGEYIVGH